jgi:hypothetical protein
MAEYSRIAKGSFTSTGAAQVINLPFQPDTVEMWNYSSFATPANHGIPRAYWDVVMGQGTAVVDLFNSTPVLTTGVITSAGISTFAAGQLLQYGPQKQIIGATAANPIVFNVTAHGYAVGDIVVFEGLYQSSTTGMPQICGIPFVISAVGDADHFSVVWPGSGSNYTALTGSPAGAYVKKVLYPYLYAPGVAFIEAIALNTPSGYTTITTTAPSNFVVGQEVAFRIPAQWGTIQLDSTIPGVSLIPGSPLYGYVVSVTNSTTFVVNINSASFTAFNTNQTVASVKAGLSFPQVLAVGDVNTGGQAISAGSSLYPSPVINGFSTINGPAIRGAFVNNTSQGFIIGAGAAASDASSVLVGSAGNVIYYEAKLHDYSAP